MAISSQSPLLGGISGKLGPITFLYRHRGSIVRSTGRTPTVGTQAQRTQAAKMQTARLRWQIITQAQRNAWNVAARKALHRDRLGRRHHITGFQFFIQINGQAPIFDPLFYDDPPSVTTRRSAGNTTLTFSASGTYIINGGAPPTPPNERGLIWTARPISTKARASFKRWIPCGIFNMIAPPNNLRPLIEPIVGTLREGEYVGVRYAIYTLGSFRGPPVEAHTFVTA